MEVAPRGWRNGSTVQKTYGYAEELSLVPSTLGNSQLPIMSAPGESNAFGFHGHLHSFTHKLKINN